MASVNKVILIGNLGRDPETRYTADGAAITNVSLATSRRYKDAAGQQQEETEWHRVVFFGRLAEVASEYLRKGRPVYVEGRLRTRKWTDKDGVEKHSTEIVAETLQFLGGARDGADSSESHAASGSAASRSGADRSAPSAMASAADGVAGLSDDIPF